MHQTPLSSERLLAPDLIRGIALIGIGAENILSFNAANEHISEYALRFSDPLNKAILTGFMLFFRGKFYPVFALLFGFAAAISLAQRGGKPFFRRSIIIAALGMMQLFLIWNGDVLVQYAVLGLLLYALKGIPGRAMSVLAAILFLASFLIPVSGLKSQDLNIGIPIQVYAEGSFFTLLGYRIPEFLQGIVSPEFWAFLARIFAFMLLGFQLGARNNYSKLLDFSKVAAWLSIALLALLVCGFILQFTGLRGGEPGSFMLQEVKESILAIFFLANVLVLILLPLLLFLQFPNLKIWTSLVATGRLTLTHYLVQNLLFSFIFFGYGLGLYLQIAPLQLWTGYILLMLFQVLISVWWLRNFKQGPVEKLVRWFAYRK